MAEYLKIRRKKEVINGEIVRILLEAKSDIKDLPIEYFNRIADDYKKILTKDKILLAKMRRKMKISNGVMREVINYA